MIKPTEDEQVAALETCLELLCAPDPLSVVKVRRVGRSTRHARPRLYVATVPQSKSFLGYGGAQTRTSVALDVPTEERRILVKDSWDGWRIVECDCMIMRGVIAKSTKILHWEPTGAELSTLRGVLRRRRCALQ